MIKLSSGAFADAVVEGDYQRSGRTARIHYVRAYVVVALLVLLAYAAASPVFFNEDELARFIYLLVPSLLVLGAYLAATFWDRYPDIPMIDFTALLALAILVTGENVILFDEINRQGDDVHGNVGISGLIVSAFAAFALTGRFRWFLTWSALHAVGFVNLAFLLDPSAEVRFYEIMSHASGAGVMLFLNWALSRADRHGFLLNKALAAERAKSEELLYNVLPEAAAERLKAGQVVADAYSDASVVFIDVVGFTKLSGTVSPGHLIDMLNAFFNLADRCAAEHGVEKVKTIGDAYLAISGGNLPAKNSADAALAFGMAVIDGLGEVEKEVGIPIQVRVGIHSGSVVGGVIGATRMTYDYWGETMNVASRLEGQAATNSIAVSESTYLRTRRKELFDAPEEVALKGVGEVPVFRLKREEPPAALRAGPIPAS
ncbi:MAG: adenylate/guanylate cyclase domain-containing protein [Allosphingosinicella sp.]|uniref:adenylate/guanylate cyclase domain-containing protein n=1 Tax=Allosphingosinicella sp. TaxID=2823234 RepID=UPI0039613F6C